MATFSNGESGSSVRTKLNSVIEKVEGDALIDNDIKLGDGSKAIFGAGSDLQIYHDGSNSYISDQGAGDLLIRSSNDLWLQNASGTETYARFDEGASTYISYAGSTKLVTTSTGVDITGVLSSDGLTVDGATQIDQLQLDDGYIRFQNATLQTPLGAAIYRPSGTADLNIMLGSVNCAKFANGGDISFYEDTGTTPKFFWDASAESLGIGTSSPSSYWANADDLVVSTSGNTGISVVSGTTSLGYLIFADSTAGGDNTRGGLGYDHSTNNMLFRVNNDTKMTIDSSGNVGIGSSVISGVLQVTGSDSVEGDAKGQIVIKDSAAYNASPTMGIIFQGEHTTGSQANMASIYGAKENATIGNYAGYLGFATRAQGSTTAERMRITSSGNVGIGTSFPDSGYKLDVAGNVVFGDGGGFDMNVDGTRWQFSLAGSEKMRITSAGDLLVGKTSADITTDGIEARNGGLFSATRNGNTVAYFDRRISDGNIQEFRRDGATVGSIGTSSGNLIVQGSTATGKTGIKFGGAEWIPQDTGANSDGGVDLGGSSYRFKDLYLSGGVYLGGTGSANKLDDYEEGTWTPTLVAATTGTNRVSSIIGSSYTKIGRSVRLTAYLSAIDGSALSGDSGNIVLGGFPFSAQNYGHLFTLYSNLSSSVITGIFSGTSCTLRKDNSQTALSPSDINAGTGNIMVNITFETA